MSANKAAMLLPWVFKPEDVDEHTGEYILPCWMGTKPDGNPTLIAEFAVPARPALIELLERLNKHLEGQI